jgi:predicted DsbA family dithiol-disulfide isomerase
VSEPIKVEIWSDIACPWCFIGKRKFERGVELFDGDVAVEYHSFELSPDTPVEFEGSAAEFLSSHKGIPEAAAKEMLDRVTAVAEQVGLTYDYDALQHTNTVKAHELLHFAKANGKQLELKERLLSAYFVEGRHIGRDADLADLAADVGLDRDQALAALSEHRHLPDVRADQDLAREHGIQGVPFFVFDGKYGVSGAQEAETFANVLQQVRNEKEPT